MPRKAAEITPANLIRVMPAEGVDGEGTPNWGIEPVPERLRVLGLLDLTLLWGNLSVSLLVIVAAAGLVPMLSFQHALLAILIGALAGNLLLGLAAAIGADARVPGWCCCARRSASAARTRRPCSTSRRTSAGRPSS